MSLGGAPACVYRGVVTHVRHAPVKHSFVYEVFMVLLDVDRLDELFAGWGWWPMAGVNRSALAAFWERDHMKLSRGGASGGGRSLSALVRWWWLGNREHRGPRTMFSRGGLRRSVGHGHVNMLSRGCEARQN